MKIIVGIDVSKATLDAFSSGKTRQFPNTPAGFKQLVQWAKTAQVFVMEATGGYHVALADFLHASGKEVSVVNPRWASHYARALGFCHKTDHLDAQVLALFAQRNELPSYVPPRQQERRLKRLARHRESLVGTASTVKQRLREPILDEFEIRQLKAQGALLAQQINQVEKELLTVVAQDEIFSSSYAFLRTVPGLGPITAILILAEGGDLRRFQNAKQFASFAGVHPKLCQSGTSIHAKPRMSKAGQSPLRKAMYMSSLAAVRKEGPCQALYVRLIKSGHSRKSALGAVMHKQVRIAFGVVKRQSPFSYEKTDLTKP